MFQYPPSPQQVPIVSPQVNPVPFEFYKRPTVSKLVQVRFRFFKFKILHIDQNLHKLMYILCTRTYVLPTYFRSHLFIESFIDHALSITILLKHD